MYLLKMYYICFKTVHNYLKTIFQKNSLVYIKHVFYSTVTIKFYYGVLMLQNKYLSAN